MLDISLQEIIDVLGSPTRTSGHQYYFRCPACAQLGNDTHEDNLLYNDRKGLLKCFACDEGANKTLHLINIQRKNNQYIAPRQSLQSQSTTQSRKTWWQENQDNLLQYMLEANDEMPSYIKQYLYETCGIDEQTIAECGIGYDANPNMVHIGASIVFPMFSLKYDTLTGFELREITTDGRKIIKHTLDSPSGLCSVWGCSNADFVVICEGFKDAYCMRQLLRQKVKDSSYLICTPAHGCNDILHNLSDINLFSFKKHYLVLDNDEAGDAATHKIIQKYPFFVDKRAILQGKKDVCDYWRSICN